MHEQDRSPDTRTGKRHSATLEPSSRPGIIAFGSTAMAPGAMLTLQRTLGNRAVARMITARAGSDRDPVVQRTTDGNRTDDEETDGDRTDDEGPETQGKPKSRAALVKEATDAAKEHADVYGAGHHGRVTDEVRLRFPRDKSGERSEQSLSHLSLLLHDAIRGIQDKLAKATPDAKKVNDREVQGMLVNDRLLFASNFNESIDALANQSQAQLSSLRDLLNNPQEEPNRRAGLSGVEANEYVDRLNRASKKINATLDGMRDAGEDATAQAVRDGIDRPVVFADAGAPNMRDLLTDPNLAGSVIMLRYGKTDPGKRAKEGARSRSMHAEQKLLAAIQSAGLKPDEVTDPIVIAGKYRPCKGCAAALRYYRDVAGFGNLQFNPNYGHYYEDSVSGLAAHLRHVVDDNYLRYLREMTDTSTSSLSNEGPPAGSSAGETRIRAEDAHGRGYVTNSDSEYEGPDEPSKKRTLRPYQPGAGGRTLGQGQEGVNRTSGNLREDTTEAERKELREAWDSGDRERQAAVFKRLHLRDSADGKSITQREIVAVTGANREMVRRLIHDLTGHEKRDDRVPGTGVIRRPRGGEKKPRGKATFTKGRELDDAGRTELHEAIRAESGKFLKRWQELQGTSDRSLMPRSMGPSLAETVIRLRGTYTVNTLAEELHIKDGSLKNFFLSHNASTRSGSTPAGDTPAPGDDVVMGEPEPDYPNFDGYDRVRDALGQVYYTDEHGRQYMYEQDSNEMRLIPAEPGQIRAAPGVGSTSAAPQPSADPMDVDELEYTTEGKGKARARKKE